MKKNPISPLIYALVTLAWSALREKNKMLFTKGRVCRLPLGGFQLSILVFFFPSFVLLTVLTFKKNFYKELIISYRTYLTLLN